MSRNTHIFSRYLHEEGIRSAGTGMFARIATLSERAPSPPSCLGARGRAAAAGGAGLGPAGRGSRHRGASERAGHAARGVWGAPSPPGRGTQGQHAGREAGRPREDTGRGKERPQGKALCRPLDLGLLASGSAVGPARGAQSRASGPVPAVPSAAAGTGATVPLTVQSRSGIVWALRASSPEKRSADRSLGRAAGRHQLPRWLPRWPLHVPTVAAACRAAPLADATPAFRPGVLRQPTGCCL